MTRGEIPKTCYNNGTGRNRANSKAATSGRTRKPPTIAADAVPMLSPETVAEIHRLSKTCGPSQIAARLNISQGEVSNILAGRRHGTPNWLKRISTLATRYMCSGKKDRDYLRARAEAGLPLFEESDYPTGTAGTRAGVDVEEPK